MSTDTDFLASITAHVAHEDLAIEPGLSASVEKYIYGGTQTMVFSVWDCSRVPVSNNVPLLNESLLDDEQRKQALDLARAMKTMTRIIYGGLPDDVATLQAVLRRTVRNWFSHTGLHVSKRLGPQLNSIASNLNWVITESDHVPPANVSGWPEDYGRHEFFIRTAHDQFHVHSYFSKVVILGSVS